VTATPATPDTGTTAALLFKGGPSLVNLLVDASEYRIVVTGPRMLYERLELLTTLSVFEGCNVYRLEELALLLDAQVYCGAVGVEPAEITIETHRTGPTLIIGLGPMSMYESELVLRTKTGETFRALLTRLLAGDPARPFIAVLHGVTATGHPEHAHH
jgi:hypothetical protein